MFFLCGKFRYINQMKQLDLVPLFERPGERAFVPSFIVSLTFFTWRWDLQSHLAVLSSFVSFSYIYCSQTYHSIDTRYKNLIPILRIAQTMWCLLSNVMGRNFKILFGAKPLFILNVAEEWNRIGYFLWQLLTTHNWTEYSKVDRNKWISNINSCRPHFINLMELSHLSFDAGNSSLTFNKWRVLPKGVAPPNVSWYGLEPSAVPWLTRPALRY